MLNGTTNSVGFQCWLLVIVVASSVTKFPQIFALLKEERVMQALVYDLRMWAPRDPSMAAVFLFVFFLFFSTHTRGRGNSERSIYFTAGTVFLLGKVSNAKILRVEHFDFFKKNLLS